MNGSPSQNYLVIRPISEDPSLVEPHLEALSTAIGLDRRTLRQRLTGTALRVLKVHQDRQGEWILKSIVFVARLLNYQPRELWQINPQDREDVETAFSH